MQHGSICTGKNASMEFHSASISTFERFSYRYLAIRTAAARCCTISLDIPESAQPAPSPLLSFTGNSQGERGNPAVVGRGGART